jgi:hypothetical protein
MILYVTCRTTSTNHQDETIPARILPWPSIE